MGILSLSDERHHRLGQFRRNTWKAIALCAALRLADAAFGFGLIEPAQSAVAQDALACPNQQEDTK